MRAHIITFGCQMNEADSEQMAGLLEGMGYECTDRAGEADVIIINTCCVRETAESKVWGLLGRLRPFKDRRPDLIVGVGGCMPQQAGIPDEIRRRFPWVDLVFGTHNRHELPNMIDRIRKERKRVHAVWDGISAIPEGVPAKRAPGVGAWIPVIHGCNNFCTYCIVPYVRGRERSRPVASILREVREAVARGYREVTLLGQNVNSYGKDLDPEADFADLLRAVNKVDGLWRIRYTSSHPRDYNDRMIEAAATCAKVCEHFHLPVQAGSNRILKKMNRGYTREYYLDLVARIRRAVPAASITTDLMVGFPGETRADFEETLDLVRRVRFAQAFTFVYNPRRGTPAARRPDQVPREVKSGRIQELIALQKKITLEQNRALEGRTVEVLVEGAHQNDPNLMSGRCRTNRYTVFPGGGEWTGRLAPVRITRGYLSYLAGEVGPAPQ